MSDKYKELAKQTRREVLKLIHKGQTSHIASCFSLTDIAVVLYENLQKDDLVIWSKGWAAALHYVLEIRRGNLDRETVFNTFPNAPYLGLLEKSCPTVITAGGSVGHGLPVAVGMALARKRAGEPGKIYCLMSDGELNEGSTWEAVMLAAHHKLDNLVAIIDKNGWQAMGKTEDVIDLEPIDYKWQAFGWGVETINGHNHDEIEEALAMRGSLMPCVIVANTIKGEGLSFTRNHLTYHYKHIDDADFKRGMEELYSETPPPTDTSSVWSVIETKNNQGTDSNTRSSHSLRFLGL